MRRQCGKWGNRLRKHGFRSTLTREIILETLEATNEHLSPEDIYNKIKKYCPTMGLATVYRTLEMLIELGLVNKMDFGDGRKRYELTEKVSKKTHHHHLVCNSCGKIVEYSDFLDEEIEFLSSIERKLEMKHNFKIQDHFIEFRGLCSSCINS